MVPVFLINKEKCLKNIRAMTEKARDQNIVLRPHFKTHQLREVGDWFREEGVNQCTVSSVDMGIFFSKHGWDDITIAFPVNVLEIDKINVLAEKVKLQLLVESVDAASFLSKNLHYHADILVKIDVGTHRTGIDPNRTDIIDQILAVLEESALLSFRGFLSHAGHTYKARGTAEIKAIYDETSAHLIRLKSRYINTYPDLIISYGDTPSCSKVKDLSSLDEIRPGNFVYYDVMQYQIGSCDLDQIAVCVECPVVAIHPDRNELVIYGGAIHFSKDRIILDNQMEMYGMVVEHQNDLWGVPVPSALLVRLSQEHGIVTMNKNALSGIKIGDTVKILPIHSCLTAHQLLQHTKII